MRNIGGSDCGLGNEGVHGQTPTNMDTMDTIDTIDIVDMRDRGTGGWSGRLGVNLATAIRISTERRLCPYEIRFAISDF